MEKTDVVMHKFPVMTFPGKMHHKTGAEIPIVLFFIDFHRPGHGENVAVNFMQIAGINVLIKIQSFILIASPDAQLKVNALFFIEITSPGIRKACSRGFDETSSFVTGNHK